MSAGDGWRIFLQQILGDLIADWKYLRPHVGPQRATGEVIKSLTGRVYGELVLLKLDIDRDRPLPLREPKITATVRHAQQADVVKFQGALLRPSRCRDFARLLRLKDIGLIAFSGEEIAAYAWVGIGPRRLLDRLGIHLTSQDAYFHTAYTFSHFRRQGLHTHLNGHRLRLAQEQNCLQAYTLVAADNIASLRSLEAIGFQRVDHLTHLRLFNKELVRHRRVAADDRICLTHR